MLTLHNYWRSGPSYRLRIALALKAVPYRYVAVSLLKDEQQTEAFAAKNPQKLIPALELADGTILTQSPAILEWLDETHPEPPLLPREPTARAKVRAMAALIACDISPLNNLRVLKVLKEFGVSQEDRDGWAPRWISEGFAALEALVAQGPGGPFCWGDAPGLADVHLIPQIFGAQRFGVDMSRFPRLSAINAAAAEHPAFQAAHPTRQPDAEAP